MALVAGPHRAASAGAKTVAVLAALILPTLLLLLLARSGGGLAAIRGNAHVAITLAVQRQQQQPAEAPRSSSPADQQQQQQQQQPTHSGGAGDVGSTPTDLPLLCGGPGGVPSLAESLAASAAALEAAADEDFAQYEQQGGFSLEDVEATAEQLGADRGDTRFVHLWFEAHNGSVVFPRRMPGDEDFDGAALLVKAGLERGMRAGKLSIPEGVPFLLNVNDQSKCQVSSDGACPCRSPLFSAFKDLADRDIAVPHFRPDFDPVFVPWSQKEERAFFRGAPICSFPGLNGGPHGGGANCSRWVVARLSWDHPELLNATLTHNVTQFGGPRHVEMPFVTHEEAARYKYLLAVDGATAAYRFAFLLATNSVVLKQETSRVEWYNRALRPCAHYLPFWVESEDDVVGLVRALRGRPANDAVAQRVAANGQAFALSHLTEEASWRHWQRLVTKYAALYRGRRRGGGGGGGGGGGQQGAAGG